MMSARSIAPSLALLALAACASVSASYSPPVTGLGGRPAKWSRTIDRPFDQVWRSLVGHFDGSEFDLADHDRPEGLMTLSFGESGIRRYVDGGRWQYQQSSGQHPVTDEELGEIEFEGNYADFLERYEGANLRGTMTLALRDMGGIATEVKIRARYEVTSHRGETWSFNTGGSATTEMIDALSGTPPKRTMRPVHRAEASILETFEAIALR